RFRGTGARMTRESDDQGSIFPPLKLCRAVSLVATTPRPPGAHLPPQPYARSLQYDTSGDDGNRKTPGPNTKFGRGSVIRRGDRNLQDFGPRGFQRFENWKLRRALRWPYFLRSTMRSSRVRKPPSLRSPC